MSQEGMILCGDDNRGLPLASEADGKESYDVALLVDDLQQLDHSDGAGCTIGVWRNGRRTAWEEEDPIREMRNSAIDKGKTFIHFHFDPDMGECSVVNVINFGKNKRGLTPAVMEKLTGIVVGRTVR